MSTKNEIFIAKRIKKLKAEYIAVEMISLKENIPFYPLKKSEFRPHCVIGENGGRAEAYGVTPSRLLAAYGLNRRFLDADGIRIAAVTAFETASLLDDVSVFCRENRIAVPTLSVVHTGESGDFVGTPEWSAEACLDLQWITATAPGAEIICVTAENALTENLMRAVKAASELNPDIVCMCFGTEESGGVRDYGEIFKKSDVVFAASSGDIGSITSFPSVCPEVLSVGGTSLTIGGNGKRLYESVWENTGSGVSELFDIPYYQRAFYPIFSLTSSKRGTPDVSLCSLVSEGVDVYCSALGGWQAMSGTSLSCACATGLCACLIKRYPEIKETGIQQFLYSRAGGTKYSTPQYFFYDVIFGSNGRYRAEIGWDLCSGLGVPTALLFNEN